MKNAMPQASAGRHGLSADDARALSEGILNLSQADHARVTIQSGRRSFTRSADNRITTAGGSTDVSAEIMSVFGKRVASVTTNRLDDAELQAAVRRSEEMARLAPEDPEYMPELAQQQYTSVSGYYDSTGEMAPDAFAEATAHAIREARGSGAVAAGYIDVRAGSQTLATSNGLFAHHPATGVASTLTMRMPDGSSSGWAGDEASDWSRIETERIATDAVRKCLDWRDKTALEPGRYTTILEPTAVGMLMLRMANAFDARPADEGRSYYSERGGGNRIGERLFDRRVTFVSDPAARDAEAAPFSDEGLPRERTVWVENGVLRDLAHSRFWAEQQGVASRPAPGNLIMSGGSDSLAEMIASTRRGVLITRFWYIRGLNPRIISYTGLTRDGTFLIENGRISRPVTNFRFNQSLAEMLQNIEMIGRPVRVAAGENSSVGRPIVVPALKVRDFHLASVSDAI
jgi:predicted Zn-dependent protease